MKIGETEITSSTAFGPSHIAVVSALFFPFIASGNLFTCAFLLGERFDGLHILLAVIAFLITKVVLNVPRLQPRARAWVSDLAYIAIRWALVIVMILALLKVAGLHHSYGDDVLMLWAFSTPLGMWVTLILLKRGLGNYARDLNGPRHAIIVGVSDVGIRLQQKVLDASLLGIKILGFFEDRAPERLPEAHRAQILGTAATVAEYIKAYDVQIVYIAIPMTRQKRIIQLLDSLRDSTVSIYFVPDLFVFNLIQARMDALGGIPMIAVCESPFVGVRGLAKRTSDLLLALPLLICISPLMLAVALGIKLTSRGPVLFKQQRYGLDGRSIWVYKFRSMLVLEDGTTAYEQVTRGDPRVTRFGAIIRKTSLDELPQLLNVIAGSMSLVGPRPHVIAVNEQYRRLIPGYMVRHKVRPGITGWAQVNGYRGGDDLPAMTKRIECDLEYLRSWSLTLDLIILLRTVVLVWKDRKAF